LETDSYHSGNTSFTALKEPVQAILPPFEAAEQVLSTHPKPGLDVRSRVP